MTQSCGGENDVTTKRANEERVLTTDYADDTDGTGGNDE